MDKMGNKRTKNVLKLAKNDENGFTFGIIGIRWKKCLKGQKNGLVV